MERLSDLRAVICNRYGAASGVRLLPALAPANLALPRLDQLRFDGYVIAFTAGISVATALLFGSAPAIQTARRDIHEALKQGATAALIGVAVGAAGALGLTRILASQLYGVSATDQPTFVAVSLLMSGMAVAASFIPARRAALLDLVVALRHE